VKAHSTSLPDVLVLEPDVYTDARGFLFESYNRRAFAAATGQDVEFVQDNHSHSRRGVLRGLHYQIGRPQGKLVRVVAGTAFDVAVDLRRSSPYFGRWVGTRLAAEDRRMIWIPPGFAHGFLALSESVELIYKITEYHAPGLERSISWCDPDVAVEWPLPEDLSAPMLSHRDLAGVLLRNAETFP